MTWENFWKDWDFWKVALPVAALVLLLAVLIHIGRRDKGRAGEIVVNLAVPAVVIGLVVVGAFSYEQAVPEGDEDSCSTMPEDAQAVLDTKKRLREKVNATKTQREAARESNRTNPSPENARALELATSAMKAAGEELRKWRGVTVTLDEDANTNFKVGHDVSSGVRTIRFTTGAPVPGPTTLPIEATSFSLAGSSQELDPETIRASAEMDKDGLNGTIRFCLVSKPRLDAASGEYAGTLVIQQGRVNRVEVPVTVSLAYPRTEKVMLAGLFIALVSSWYVYFLRRPGLSASILLGHPASEDEAAQLEDSDQSGRVLRWKFGFWQGYWRWISSATGAVTIVAGTIGAVTAFTTAYLASDTWSGSFKDWFAFSGAVATAFIAAGTAGRLAGQEFDKPLKPGD